MAPGQTELSELSAGDVGYIVASIKDIRSCRVGDTITDSNNPTEEPLPGYKSYSNGILWYISRRRRKV